MKFDGQRLRILFSGVSTCLPLRQTDGANALKLDEPMPRAAIFQLFVVLPLMIAVFMAIVAVAIAAWLDTDTVPIGVLLVAVSFAILANGLRALLSCIDWFETRMKTKRGTD